MPAPFPQADVANQQKYAQREGTPDLTCTGRITPKGSKVDGWTTLSRAHAATGCEAEHTCGHASNTRSRAFRRVESKDKRIALHPGALHGWDLVQDAPFAGKARAVILASIRGTPRAEARPLCLTQSSEETSTHVHDPLRLTRTIGGMADASPKWPIITEPQRRRIDRARHSGP
jgi:hypothetical protein